MPNKQMNTLVQILLFSVLLSGCTQKFQDTTDTLSEAFLGFGDVEMSEQQVSKLEYASLYAKINDGPKIFMVLAFAENNPATGHTRLKWLSADRAMIVTENGRITKTLKLPGSNLANLSSSTRLTVPSNQTKSWNAVFDWQPSYNYGSQAQVTSKAFSEQVIDSLLWEKRVTRIQETYNFNQLGESMQSDFWVDTSGNVVKSSQWLIPSKLHVELEILKPYEAN